MGSRRKHTMMRLNVSIRLPTGVNQQQKRRAGWETTGQHLARILVHAQ
jgi:hypothetical protein